jgi:hypothetical protein
MHRSRVVWCSLAVFVLALIVRWPHLSQSLWYDEMYTLVEYVQQPWQRVLAGRPGEYVPNNHVLHTVLAKLVYSIGHRADDVEPNEALLRVPALIAGCLLPIALAWPMRRVAPWTALLIAVVAAVHPWLVAFSTEARGYSLMLLLAVVATNLLPDGSRRWPIWYALALTAAIFTIPIALLLIPAHAVALGGRYRTNITAGLRAGYSWIRSVVIAAVLATALYSPQLSAMARYYRHPYETTITYREFLDQLPRYSLAGERLPREIDPILRLQDPPAAAVFWALPVLTLFIGSVIGWRRMELRRTIDTFGYATCLAMLLALVSPHACEVRFVPWIGVWFIIAVAAILTSATQRWARGVAIVGVALLLSLMGWFDVTQLPNQPVREAIALADKLAPPGVRIVVTYIGARESASLYIDRVKHHQLEAAHDMPRFVAAEQEAVLETGRRPWLIVLYEDLARRRNHGAEDSAGLWTTLVKEYRVVERLPGRVSPVAIYAPREAGGGVAIAPGDFASR